jgi:hypothetical protein
MSQYARLQPFWDRLQQRALLAGVAGLVLCGLGVLLNPTQFFRSYLLAYLFWFGIPLGCLAILMVHHLVGGAWGAVIRRVLESSTRTFPLLVLLFVPLLFGLHELYIWARPEVVTNDALFATEEFVFKCSLFHPAVGPVFYHLARGVVSVQ